MAVTQGLRGSPWPLLVEIVAGAILLAKLFVMLIQEWGKFVIYYVTVYVCK